MIKGIAGGIGITVSGGNTSIPYVNMMADIPMQGMIRIWGSDMQVYSGSSWQNLTTSYATVSLDLSTDVILQRANKAMAEEAKIKALIQKHPGLKSSWEQFEIMKILVTEESNSV